MATPDEMLDAALQFTLQWEGGYVNHPADPGGATNKGVIQSTYDTFRKNQGLPTQSVRAITDAEVHAIYKSMYWQAARCDALPWPLCAAHFDAAVNTGTRQAAKLLQRALGVADDGLIGKGTLAAAAAADPLEAAEAAADRRQDFYNSLVRNKPSLGVFLKGWTRRVSALKVFVGAAPVSFDPSEHAPEPTQSLVVEMDGENSL